MIGASQTKVSYDSLEADSAHDLRFEQEVQDVSLEAAMQRTTDLVAASVSVALKSAGLKRVLVFGRHSFFRAKYLAATVEFPSRTFPLTLSSDRLPCGVYWTGDAEDLVGFPPHTFDAVMCFNVADDDKNHLRQVLSNLEDMVRPGGCFTGTGVFAAHSIDEDIFESATSCRFSLPQFREFVEDIGFFMHILIDMSLEGNVMLMLHQEGGDDQDLQDIQEGKLVCARFLATKNERTASRRARSFHSVSATPSLHAKLGLKPSTPQDEVKSRFGHISPHQLSPSSLSYNFPSLSLASSPLLLSQASPRIVISGVSMGLPNGLDPNRRVFDSNNFESIFNGENRIQSLSDEDKKLIKSTNPYKVEKKDGKRVNRYLTKDEEIVQVASKIVNFDLCKEYGVPSFVVDTLDQTYKLAIAAGIEALRDAGIELSAGTSKDSRRPTLMGLPDHMRDETGVIFASSFPCLDSAVQEISMSAAHNARQELEELKEGEQPTTEEGRYEYNRKLLFRLLVMANCQLAELIKARGPNTHVNAACSSSSQAVTLAEDWIKAGRCKRVVVIAADDVTNENLLPYVGTGFLALGAATICSDVQEAAVPFDVRRKGMILGAGACGLVIERSDCVLADGRTPKAELIASRVANSAFHASLIDKQHVAQEFENFLTQIEGSHRIDRHTLAKDCLYFSHETCTFSQGGCAKSEMDLLEGALGTKSKNDMLICNTKGFTGHPMGACLEDVVAVKSLDQNKSPPIANHKKTDPCLGDIQLSQGGTHDRNYALRFSAGFGSQLVFILFKKWMQ